MLDIYFCHPDKNILFVAVSFSRVQFILSNCACNVSNVSVYVEFYYDGTSAGMTPRYHHRPRLNYEDDEDCVEWQRARDDEAQTDAFQCRLTARLVNLIFFSRHIYYRRVQFCERGKERERKKRSGGKLLTQDRLIHAVGATTRPTCVVEDGDSRTMRRPVFHAR